MRSVGQAKVQVSLTNHEVTSSRKMPPLPKDFLGLFFPFKRKLHFHITLQNTVHCPGFLWGSLGDP
jgi:hypothetical protein